MSIEIGMLFFCNYSAAPHLLRHRPAHVRISTLRRPLSRIWGTAE